MGSKIGRPRNSKWRMLCPINRRCCIEGARQGGRSSEGGRGGYDALFNIHISAKKCFKKDFYISFIWYFPIPQPNILLNIHIANVGIVYCYI